MKWRKIQEKNRPSCTRQPKYWKSWRKRSGGKKTQDRTQTITMQKWIGDAWMLTNPISDTIGDQKSQLWRSTSSRFSVLFETPKMKVRRKRGFPTPPHAYGVRSKRNSEAKIRNRDSRPERTLRLIYESQLPSISCRCPSLAFGFLRGRSERRFLTNLGSLNLHILTFRHLSDKFVINQDSQARELRWTVRSTAEGSIPHLEAMLVARHDEVRVWR
jgi:hypothetical protein